MSLIENSHSIFRRIKYVVAIKYHYRKGPDKLTIHPHRPLLWTVYFAHVLSKEIGHKKDAVDYKLISICQKRDIIVSQDYGITLALSKGAYAIHQSGKWYTNENIDQMLMERHLNKKTPKKLS